MQTSTQMFIEDLFDLNLKATANQIIDFLEERAEGINPFIKEQKILVIYYLGAYAKKEISLKEFYLLLYDTYTLTESELNKIALEGQIELKNFLNDFKTLILKTLFSLLL